MFRYHIRWKCVWIAFLYKWWHKDTMSLLGHQYLEKRWWFLSHTYQFMSVRLHHHRCAPPPSLNKQMLIAVHFSTKANCDQGVLMPELSTHHTTSCNIKIPLNTSPMCSKLISVEDQTTARLLYTSSLSTKLVGCYLNIISTWLTYHLGKCSACPVPPFMTWA